MENQCQQARVRFGPVHTAQILAPHFRVVLMAFVYTGETANTLELFERAGKEPRVLFVAWQPSVQSMMSSLVEMIRAAVIPEGKTVMIVADPMGVDMRDEAGTRINIDGPKDVFWFSSEPDYLICRHPTNGQIGRLHAPVRERSVVGGLCVHTGQVTLVG